MARIPVHISTLDTAGNAQANISATVKNRASGTNVTLYALESGGSTVSNPLVTDANGRAFAYADRQGLRIDYTGTGFTAYTEYREDAVPPTDIVSALPGSPFDGQEIYFQNAGMATLGVLWHLRYRSVLHGNDRWRRPNVYHRWHLEQRPHDPVRRDIAPSRRLQGAGPD